MALYQRTDVVQHTTHQAFDTRHSPGSDAPFAGIYRCTGCGDEIGIAKGHKLPPQNHHQHQPGSGAVQWQLLVFAQQH